MEASGSYMNSGLQDEQCVLREVDSAGSEGVGPRTAYS